MESSIWKQLQEEDRDWDYGFLLDFECEKLKSMAEWYEKNDYGSSTRGKRVYKQLKLAVNLLNIILGKEDWWDIDMSELEYCTGVPTADDFIVKKYVNTRNSKRFLGYEGTSPTDQINLREQKAWHHYHVLRFRYMRDWWD